jgi:hypothetical protein
MKFRELGKFREKDENPELQSRYRKKKNTNVTRHRLIMALGLLLLQSPLYLFMLLYALGLP